MNIRYRWNARAEAHQARLRELLLPRLGPGNYVPRARFVGRILGVDESTAGKHLRRLLKEADVVTRCAVVDGVTRRQIVSMEGQP